MKIRVLYFAGLREALGVGHESIDTNAATASALRAELCARGGVWAERLGDGRNVRVAVDQTIVRNDADLTEGAEVAFFPPVTGG